MNAEGFVIIPAAVMAMLSAIGGNGLVVYAILAEHVSGSSGDCFPSRATISTRAGVSSASVDRAIQRLLKAKLINVKRRGRMESNIYTLSESSPVSSHTESESSPMMTQGKVSRQKTQSESSKRPEVSRHRRRPNKNQLIRTNNKKISAATDPRLLELIDGWNELGTDIAKPVRRDPPPKEVADGWGKVALKPEWQEAFSDIPAIQAGIRKAKFCHGKGWFTLSWLLGNKGGEFNAAKLLQGRYDDAGQDNRPSANGKQGKSGSNHRTDSPARSRQRDYSNLRSVRIE